MQSGGWHFDASLAFATTRDDSGGLALAKKHDRCASGRKTLAKS